MHRCILIRRLSHISRVLHVLNILFLPVPAFTFSTITLKLEHQIKTLIKISSQKWLQTIKNNMAKRTHVAIRTLVEDAALVGTLLFHSVLQHNLLLKLAARNEREVRP